MKTEDIEKFLIAEGFKPNRHGDAWDKGNTRVFFSDINIHVVRYNNPVARVIKWNNLIDGNMPLDAQKSLISSMAGL